MNGNNNNSSFQHYKGNRTTKQSPVLSHNSECAQRIIQIKISTMNILAKTRQCTHTLALAGFAIATTTTTAVQATQAHTTRTANFLSTLSTTSAMLTQPARMFDGLATSELNDSVNALAGTFPNTTTNYLQEPDSNESAESAEAQPDLFDLLRNECYEQLNSTTTKFKAGESYCAGTFDGWLCWPDTAAGTSAYERCPKFITGFDPTRFAHKECGKDGEWFRHPLNNKTWSNYTTCVDLDDLQWKHSINLIYETGYGISLVAILLSLAILSYFKTLKCARITLHMNLFTSFAAHNTLWLIWYLVVLPDTALLQKSPPSCVALHIILHYFLLTNYSWMLCEGFYLHTVLVSAFISEKKLVKWLIAFGWGSPAIVIFIYGLARGLGGTESELIHCWMSSTDFGKIFVVPVCISMFLNLLFLCNIVRVVLLKLKAPASIQGSCGPSRTILQAFRATLLLVPLLGLQYIVTPLRPDPGHPWEQTYEVISAFTASFQGLCVATLFCFFNGEVIAQVKRRWRVVCFSNRTRANSYTATQVSFVRCGPPLPGEEKV